MKRAEATKIAIAAGAKVTGSVSKSTCIVMLKDWQQEQSRIVEFKHMERPILDQTCEYYKPGQNYSDKNRELGGPLRAPRARM